MMEMGLGATSCEEEDIASQLPPAPTHKLPRVEPQGLCCLKKTKWGLCGNPSGKNKMCASHRKEERARKQTYRKKQRRTKYIHTELGPTLEKEPLSIVKHKVENRPHVKKFITTQTNLEMSKHDAVANIERFKEFPEMRNQYQKAGRMAERNATLMDEGLQRITEKPELALKTRPDAVTYFDRTQALIDARMPPSDEEGGSLQRNGFDSTT